MVVRQAGETSWSSVQPHTPAWRPFQHGLSHFCTVLEPFICPSSLTNSFHLKFLFFCPLDRLCPSIFPGHLGQSVLGSYVTCGKRLLNTIPWCPFSCPCLLFFYSLSRPSFLVLLCCCCCCCLFLHTRVRIPRVYIPQCCDPRAGISLYKC